MQLFFSLILVWVSIWSISSWESVLEESSHVATASTVRNEQVDTSILPPVTATPVAYVATTTPLLTLQSSASVQAEKKAKLLEALTLANAALLLEYKNTAEGTTVSYDDRFFRSLENSEDNRREATRSITLNGELTNATLDGTTVIDGMLGIGTATPVDVLSVAGAVYIDESTPSSVTNRLYNSGGDLYWNGAVVGGSSTSPWSLLSGDISRVSGNVGIGTSTPSATLSVDGTALFTGTTTAPLVDAGGQMCNVTAYGAVGDNATLNDAAIAAAIADCPEGGIVYFPMGQFRISSPIVLDRPVTLRGAYSPRWSYSSIPRSSIRADFGSFSGVAMVHVRDRTISGETNHNNGGRLEHLMLDGGSASTNVDGIYFEGLVRDWKLTDVDISQVTGNGFEAAVGTGSGNPRGFTIRGLSIYSADGHGFRATALNDSYIDDLLAVGNALRGIYLSSMGETKIANSRAVFNGLSGLYIDGSSNNGGITFTDFSTDRNDRHGVRIAATGTSTIIFNGLLTRRDGPNTSGGSETPYAGVAIIGSSTAKVSPVFISGLGQTVGVDDVGAPPLSPSTGVRVTNATYVKIDGQLWGVDESWRDDGGNDYFIIEDDAILKTGTDGTQELFASANNWQATSTNELVFGNTVNIGDEIDSRLLNIVASTNAGARFRDTTNDVTFDMRAEDFQAFFGTFSNHQLRFQTNNTSRLTIGTNGYVGIGTTSPKTMLQVNGVITPNIDNTYSLGNSTYRFSEIFSANGVINTSDRRLKDNITLVPYGLDTILELDPVSFTWKDAPEQGTKFGLIAQDVEALIPEIVHEGDDANETLGVRYTELIPILIKSVQELWGRMTGYEAAVGQLETRISELEAEVSVLRDGVSDQESNQNSDEQHLESASSSQPDHVAEDVITDIASASSSATSSTPQLATASSTEAMLVVEQDVELELIVEEKVDTTITASSTQLTQ